MRNIEELYDLWLNGTGFESYGDELRSIEGNGAEIRERFYRELDFGTAGIRGIMGAGTNRMNVHVVRRVSCAIAKHISLLPKDEKRIVVGYDSRNNSRLFAEEAAAAFAAYGIKTYIHPDISPVPLLSFSVRNLKCDAGVMITASHNPKEYNGYKVYGPDGAQLSGEDSDAISAIVGKMSDYSKIPSFNFSFLYEKGYIKDVPARVREEYISTIMKLVEKPQSDNGLTVVYTPIHGAGAKFVPAVLKKLGIRNIYTVKEQMEPDGYFPTVPVPNPEDPRAYTLAIELAKSVNADILLATDPDSDRTGAFILNKNGEYEMLNGNEIGELLLDRRTSVNVPDNAFAVSTIVSTRLAKVICESRGVSYTDVLTGFKFIGEQIVNREENGNEKFIFGFEESYGYLAGSYARDKDAVASCLMLAEAAVYYKGLGMTLLDALEGLYRQYGAQSETQFSMVFEGEAGACAMASIMTNARNKLDGILPERPLSVMDVSKGIRYVYSDSGTKEEPLDLPESNVLHYTYEDFWFCLRPSGTEPKIKVYFGSSGADRAESKSKLPELKAKIQKAIDQLK